jgi:hypothetical protein
VTSVDPNENPLTVAAVRRLFLLSALPFVGFAIVVAGAVLGFTDFSHNNSLSCGDFSSFGSAPGCTHDSYTLAVTLAVVGVVVMFGGAIFASYYAARRVGLPIVNAVLRGRRLSRMQPPVSPPPEG